MLKYIYLTDKYNRSLLNKQINNLFQLFVCISWINNVSISFDKNK